MYKIYMSLLLEKEIFYINSKNRIGGSDEDFLFNLVYDVEKKYDRVVILQASVPKSYYSIQADQNSFILEENTTQAIIYVPIGTYTRKSFRNKLIQLLNLNSPNGWTYNVTIPNTNVDPDNGKYTFSVTGNGTSQPLLIFTSFLYEQFGFDRDSTNTFVGDQLTSKNVINLNIESTIYIRSDICQNKNDNVLQEIFTTNSQSFGNIVFKNKNVEEYSKPFIPSKNIYRFFLTDENNNKLNLNGSNFVFTLMLYKRNDYYLMAKEFYRNVAYENLIQQEN